MAEEAKKDFTEYSKPQSAFESIKRNSGRIAVAAGAAAAVAGALNREVVLESLEGFYTDFLPNIVAIASQDARYVAQANANMLQSLGVPQQAVGFFVLGEAVVPLAIAAAAVALKRK